MSDLSDDNLVAEIREAYAAAVDGWAAGPSVLYRRMATALLATSADELAGGRVLDLGAGTGVVSQVLRTIGAHPVGLDLAVEMLAHGTTTRPPGVVGDAQRLPFHDGAFDAVVAGFSLNHVPDLRRALTECRRALRHGGLLLASTFESGDDHPAKAIVDGVLERYGYQRPTWYGTFKSRVAQLTGVVQRLERSASEAGFVAVRVERVPVEAGLDDPRQAVDWRLNMPHTLAYVASLDARTQVELRRTAIRALAGSMPSAVRMLVLRCRTDPSLAPETHGLPQIQGD